MTGSSLQTIVANCSGYKAKEHILHKVSIKEQSTI